MAASFQDRKRFAEKAGIEAKAYWLKQSRFIQQVGDAEPIHVPAAPEAPALVLLPHGKKVTRTFHNSHKRAGETYEHDEIKPDRFLVEAKDVNDPPEKPLPTHQPPHRGAPVRKAPDMVTKGGKGKGDKGGDETAKEEVRAADK